MKCEVIKACSNKIAGMEIGEIAEWKPYATHDEALVLRTYSGWVNLKDPKETWNTVKPDTIGVLLPKGSKVILEV